MAATVDHPAFSQPPDFSSKIWRYMDFAKFVFLLDTSNLYLARLDQLADQFEGSLSKAEYDHWKEVAEEGERTGEIPDQWKGKYFDVLLANARRTRRACYVSCWHMSESESDAMWRLYAPTGLGVAVQSTYQRLVDVLPDKLHRGCFARARWMRRPRDRRAAYWISRHDANLQAAPYHLARPIQQERLGRLEVDDQAERLAELLTAQDRRRAQEKC
jgi:hypothetical protein